LNIVESGVKHHNPKASFGAIYILVISEGGNQSIEKFTFRLHNCITIEQPRHLPGNLSATPNTDLFPYLTFISTGLVASGCISMTILKLSSGGLQFMALGSISYVPLKEMIIHFKYKTFSWWSIIYESWY
jgi:hypothetical protein